MTASNDTFQTVRSLAQEGYKYGFVTDIEADEAPPGLTEDTVRFISAKKEEPEWLLEWRLAAFRAWRTMTQPNWAKLHLTPIDYQDATYYSAPRKSAGPKSLDEVDPELLRTYEKLGIPLREREALAGVAVDAVFDSISVATTFKEELGKLGIIFCSMGEAVREHPDLVRRYLGTVVPQNDNFFAALNSAVFSDGSFAYVPPGVRCPMELSTYFRINAAKSGQFERTLLIADAGSYVSYLEGCTAPQRDENQLQTGSAITWKYPSCVLEGDHSVGEFYSVAITNNRQQADTGTKMIHIGKDTRSTIVAKGISAGRGQNTYRGLVRMQPRARGARNHTQCDSLLIGERCGAHTVPYIEVRNPSARVEHEATTSKISDDQLFYCRQRGLSTEDAVSLIVNGFCKEVLKELPMEFAVEAQKLLAVSLEGSVG